MSIYRVISSGCQKRNTGPAFKEIIIKTVLEIVTSSIGKKIVMALSGLGLFVFIAVHLLGNLSFFAGQDAFNSYSHKLTSLGPLLYLVEIGLITVFIFHVLFALLTYRENTHARNVKYKTIKNAGSPSLKTISSRSMFYTGVVIFVFIIIHLKTFKYGPSFEDGYIFTSESGEMRNLYRLVVEIFQKPLYVIVYVSVMIILGTHLRHGFWSAFQSLGIMHPRYTKLIYGLGVVLAIVIAIGFLVLPLYVLLGGGS